MSACSNQLRSSTGENNACHDLAICDKINLLFPEWDSYPLNLAKDYDEAVLCVKFYHELLAKERRLTSDDEKTKIETITVAPAEGNQAQLIYTDIESSRELEYYASKCKNLTGPVLSFVIMQPVYPWGQLQISDEVLKKLLTFNKNSPLLLDVINLFGDHIETANEEFPVYWEEYKPDKVPAENQIDPFVSRTTEVGYNIKYAVNLQHLIKCTNMIWVTRKMGVSAKHFVDAGNTAWNFIQPCSLFVERLKRVVEQDKDRNWPRRHDIEIHLLAFESANQNWTSYITYLEGKYIGMNAAAFCWRPSVKDDLAYMQNPESQGLQFTDTQTLQCLKDKLLQISYALEINHGNLNSLRNGWSRLYKKHKRRNEIDARFANLLLIIHQQKSRANSLIERCTSLQSLIPAMLARRENAVMRMLSEKSMENSRSMKVITIFTLCYLPPSFVATFFGMSFWSQASGAEALSYSSQLAYFFSLSFILVLFTFGSWRWWESKKSTKMKLQDLEKESIVE